MCCTFSDNVTLMSRASTVAHERTRKVKLDSQVAVAAFSFKHVLHAVVVLAGGTSRNMRATSMPTYVDSVMARNIEGPQGSVD